MRRLVFVTVCLVGAVAASTPAAPEAEIDNLAAFARLYGVVRWFYPGDAAATLDWNRLAVLGVSRVRSADDPASLLSSLEAIFAPIAPDILIGTALPPAPPAGPTDATLVAWRYYGAAVNPAGTKNTYVAGRSNRLPGPRPANGPPGGEDPLTAEWPDPRRRDHVDVDLARGLRARVPLALTAADAARRDPGFAGLVETLAAAPADSAADRDVNLADVIVAWNVYRHFYPYWRDLASDPRVDWDAQLRGLLNDAATATRAQRRDVLLRLVAGVHDGHGRISNPSTNNPGALPFTARVIEGTVVVIASTTSDVRAGAVITAIDGAPAEAWLAARASLASGTPQWRAAVALRQVRCDMGSTAAVTLRDGAAAPRTVNVPCAVAPLKPLTEGRPPAVAELKHGIWYVDLTRASMLDITPKLEAIAGARGVVFDVRGYPTDAGFEILPHLIDAPERDRWMHVERIVGPFGRVADPADFGWNLPPKHPYVRGARAFLTDGRAISYAESVMGYVADRRLGEIVGSPTAGANGNVVSFTVPSGHAISLTGMRVTRHDGTSRFHMIGVLPTVPLEPTLAGVRAGRDELLERALAVVDGRDLAPRRKPPGAP